MKTYFLGQENMTFFLKLLSVKSLNIEGIFISSWNAKGADNEKVVLGKVREPRHFSAKNSEQASLVLICV